MKVYVKLYFGWDEGKEEYCTLEDSIKSAEEQYVYDGIPPVVGEEIKHMAPEQTAERARRVELPFAVARVIVGVLGAPTGRYEVITRTLCTGSSGSYWTVSAQLMS